MDRLLIVDDDPQVRLSLESTLASDELEVMLAATAREGLALLESHPPGAVVLDVRLPDMSGLEAFDLIRKIDPRLPVIIITAHATTETAIEAMKRGAFEYLLKPVDLHQLRELLAKAIQVSRMRHVPAVFEEAAEHDDSVDRIVGHSPVMQEVYKSIGRVAPLDVNVLILGESGTGKELVARAIYHHSSRRDKPYEVIDCAAVPEALLESELFGHERGAFTSADRRRIGKFEQSSTGTLLLDEIGDLPLPTQAKLLRLLQEQRFNRVGGNETIQTNVRLIAATNQKLDELVATGRFREDLFYRLKVYTIYLPPLRERRDDLPLLVEHLIHRFNREFGKQVRAAHSETLSLLSQHAWPGNVRELQNTLKFAMIHATGDTLTPDCLPENLRGGAMRPMDSEASLDVARLVAELLRTGQPDIYKEVCSAVDRVMLDQVLRHVDGNQVQASELLGISRNTLRAKLRLRDLGADGIPHDANG
jgi:nitrogen regulation protein NR(I)